MCATEIVETLSQKVISLRVEMPIASECGFDVAMTQAALDAQDVRALLDHDGGRGVSQRMYAQGCQARSRYRRIPVAHPEIVIVEMPTLWSGEEEFIIANLSREHLGEEGRKGESAP